MHDSFSNRAILGPAEITPGRSFEYVNDSSDAVTLRDEFITSIVRDIDGTWLVVGGTMKAGVNPASNPLRYVGVQRTLDNIEAQTVRLARRRWNRNQKANFVSRLVADVNDYLSLLKTNGILGNGSVAFPHPTQNTRLARAAGLVYVAIDARFPAVNEQINYDVEASLV